MGIVNNVTSVIANKEQKTIFNKYAVVQRRSFQKSALRADEAINARRIRPLRSRFQVGVDSTHMSTSAHEMTRIARRTHEGAEFILTSRVV